MSLQEEWADEFTDKILGGGNSHDFLSGGTGNDSLYGDDGNDRLVGSAESSTFLVRAGQTSLGIGPAAGGIRKAIVQTTPEHTVVVPLDDAEHHNCLMQNDIV